MLLTAPVCWFPEKLIEGIHSMVFIIINEESGSCFGEKQSFGWKQPFASAASEAEPAKVPERSEDQRGMSKDNSSSIQSVIRQTQPPYLQQHRNGGSKSPVSRSFFTISDIKKNF